ncbi:hypothetical protein [Undibacterium fentianense]|uniref:Uncharacterized protein n=1 Tax=Undibacterium fentianense TaxID=2828728 RepID=A0A941IEM0_9BURK|nr:hypothetical protein [Undibacterium fentianense]MBR7799532.1 hypothetical protein [Undibacterium fentianense]
MKFPLKTMVLGIAMLSASPIFAQNLTSGRTQFDATAVAKATAAREPSGLRSAAFLGLRTLINDLAKDLKAGSLPSGFPFDVNDLSELKTAELGLGFEVYSAHPQTLLAGGRPFEQMVMGTGVWNFVVLVDKHPVALLEMEKFNGKWQVNGAGASKLAQDVMASTQNHAGRNAFRFIRIYQATADFLEVKDLEGKAKFAPLIAARQSLRMTNAIAADASLAGGQDILPSLQEAVRGHLDRFGK